MSDPVTYPVLPLRDIVVFPSMVVPLFVGRDKSVKALENVMENDKKILLVAQKDAGDNDPSPEDIYEVGVIASVLQLLKLPDGTVKVLVEGERRISITEYTRTDDYFEAVAGFPAEVEDDDADIEGLSRSVISQFESYVKLNKRVPPEVIVSINQIDDAGQLADTVASHLNIKISEKQELLEVVGVAERLEKVYALMEGEMSVLQVEKKIRNRVKRQMEKTQREYYLN
ncbi:MAG: LON peptidase substrate-binding domain-containing protein, partial [Pseudomonadota bacterium]